MSREITNELLRKNAFWFLRKEKCGKKGLGCSVVLSELSGQGADRPDAIGWRYAQSVVVECIRTRSDFLEYIANTTEARVAVGQHRFFIAPRGLISLEELPPDWGLLELEGTTVVQTKEAPPRALSRAGHEREKKMLLSVIRDLRKRSLEFIDTEDREP